MTMKNTMNEPSDEQIMKLVGGPLTSMSDSRPLGQQYGPTPLIAAMRCYVASKLGGTELFLPKELI